MDLRTLQKSLQGPLPLQNETTTFILANVLDIFVTYSLLRLGGLEANPVARFFLDGWGFDALIGYKMGVIAVVCVLAQVIAIYRQGLARGVLWVGTALVGAVVVYGLYLISQQL